MKRFVSGLLLVAVCYASARGDETAVGLVVHDLSLWIVEQNASLANARLGYKTALPVPSARTGAVTAPGGQQLAAGTFVAGPGVMVGGTTTFAPAAPAGAANPSRPMAPVGMLTFYGPTSRLDVELRVRRGAILAHWPAAEAMPNRLQWAESAGTRLVDRLEDESLLAYVDTEHWIRKARQGEALYVRRGARAERFLAYDAELPLAAPLRLEGGPDTFRLINTTPYKVHDVLVTQSTPEGRRVAWLDAIEKGTVVSPANAGAADRAKALDQMAQAAAANAAERPGGNDLAAEVATALAVAADEEAKKAVGETKAAAGVEVVLSAPLKADDPALVEQTTAALAKRLALAGLKSSEVELFLANYAPRFFDDEAIIVACRLEVAAIDELVGVSVFPEPAHLVRVPLVVSRHADPRLGSEVDRLVDQLGDSKYAVREAAQRRLIELGPAAFPALQQAATRTDLEIVIRAERILLNQGQTIGGGPQQPRGPQAAPAAPVIRAIVPN